MKTKLLYLLIFVVTINLYADTNPIPDDPNEATKMAEEIKAQIRAEIAETKKIQEQRAIAEECVKSSISDIKQKKDDTQAFVKKTSPIVKKLPKTPVVAFPKGEEARYEKFSF